MRTSVKSVNKDGGTENDLKWVLKPGALLFASSNSPGRCSLSTIVSGW